MVKQGQSGKEGGKEGASEKQSMRDGTLRVQVAEEREICALKKQVAPDAGETQVGS